MDAINKGPHHSPGQSLDERDLASLVARAQGADAEAFETLARRYSPVVLAYLYGRLPSSLDARDILQDVLLSAFRHLSALRDPGRFGPWLLQIARRKRADHLRAYRRVSARELNTDRLPEIEEAESTAHHPAPDAAAQETIRAAIGRLPTRYRLVVSLRLLEEMPPAGIAQRLGLKESTVRMRNKRGLEMLRKSLRKSGLDA